MRTWVMLLLAAVSGAASALGPDPAPPADEVARTTTLDSGVRVHLNLPTKIDSAKPSTLVLYATPNGSTLEQTLGAAKAEGVDWRFDIQHVAAQIRRLREVDPSRNVALAVVQAPKLSWPAFRQSNADAGTVIRQVVETSMKDAGATRVVLSGHSGGGSFVFGFINAHDAIPEVIERIVLLDANYAYADEQRHGDKLLEWLRGDAARRLVVVAYDDREITLDGKKVVGPQGGTFRATARMVDRLRREGEVRETTEGPFTRYRAMDGQIECFVHANPENKILHTALVGEMNGLLHGLTLGTPAEVKWGTFGGPRAYAKWVRAAATAPTTAPAVPPVPALKIPDRPKDAPGGATFVGRIEKLSAAEREVTILREVTRGNVPSFLRALKPIRVEMKGEGGATHAAVYFVTPDYLAVGSDDDFVRLPMTPMTAAAIAGAFDASLITRKVSDDVFRQADVRLAPQPLTEKRESPRTFLAHHQSIEKDLGAAPHARGALVAGIKKDVVISNRLSEKPQRVAIYGWHRENGIPIQPLSIVHVETYVDYSHGVRLMSRRVMVDGQEADALDLLKNPTRAALLSDEGAITTSYTLARAP